MHKKVLLVVLIFLLVGCKKIENNDNYIELVSDCLKKNSITNDVSIGYKYYIPRGVMKIVDYDYNQVFKVDGDSLYLYVDIISYYHKEKIEDIKSGNEYYYKDFNYNNKSGSIKINKSEDKYLVRILYNYSRIEFFCEEDRLDKLITLSSIILNSIKYNDIVIEKVLEGNIGKFSEFTYEVEKPDDAGSNFSKYLEEYVQKEEKDKKTEQLPDDE